MVREIQIRLAKLDPIFLLRVIYTRNFDTGVDYLAMMPALHQPQQPSHNPKVFFSYIFIVSRESDFLPPGLSGRSIMWSRFFSAL